MPQHTRQGWEALEAWRAFDGESVEGFRQVWDSHCADGLSIEGWLPLKNNGAYGHLSSEKRPNVLVASFEGRVEAKVLWGDEAGTEWVEAFPGFLEE